VTTLAELEERVQRLETYAATSEEATASFEAEARGILGKLVHEVHELSRVTSAALEASIDASRNADGAKAVITRLTDELMERLATMPAPPPDEDDPGDGDTVPGGRMNGSG
jgi:hypothetical protein